MLLNWGPAGGGAVRARAQGAPRRLRRADAQARREMLKDSLYRDLDQRLRSSEVILKVTFVFVWFENSVS